MKVADMLIVSLRVFRKKLRVLRKSHCVGVGSPLGVK